MVRQRKKIQIDVCQLIKECIIDLRGKLSFNGLSVKMFGLIESRRLRLAWYVARMEEGRSAFKILAGEPTGDRPLGRPRRKWEYDIRKDLKEIGILDEYNLG